METIQNFTAFSGQRRIATGDLRSILLHAKEQIEQEGEVQPVLVFDDSSGQQVEFDLRGTPEAVLQRLATHPHLANHGDAPKAGPGRPKLGVICREVSLLPRHWQWLEQQPQGASAALRRLVDEARKRDPEGERLRSARDAAAKFMWTMAGDLPGFEEASRTLFAGDYQQLEELIREWPADIRDHVLRLLMVHA
jgi:hypothetical protein